VATARGNQDLLFVLADRALRSVEGLDEYVAVQRRHPDGHRWVDVHRFIAKQDAERVRDHLLAMGEDPRDIRVHVVRIDNR
jgi:hypothetical protein